MAGHEQLLCLVAEDTGVLEYNLTIWDQVYTS